MRTVYDFSPLYRSMIGADRMAALIDSAMKSEADRGYPPYDVEKTGEDGYRITIAAAGFGPQELAITAQANLLVVAGRKAKEEEDGARTFLHRGIAARNFERKFELADYVVVKSAHYENGVLAIDLERQVPEAMKPRKIEIGLSDGESKVEHLNARQAKAA